MARRLNLALPPQTITRVEAIRDLTSASSNTEVIRSAILTYEALVEWLSEGADFYVKKPDDGQYTPIKFLIDVEKSLPQQ